MPRLAKLPRVPVDASALEAKSAEYLDERNKILVLKRKKAEMELAQARGQLIEKDLATRQVAYLLPCPSPQATSQTGPVGLSHAAQRPLAILQEGFFY